MDPSGSTSTFPTLKSFSDPIVEVVILLDSYLTVLQLFLYVTLLGDIIFVTIICQWTVNGKLTDPV